MVYDHRLDARIPLGTNRSRRQGQDDNTYTTRPKQYSVMCMELRNAPATFQRLIEKVLDGL